MKGNGEVPEDDVEETVFSKYITLKSGRRLYASSYGLKAFALKIRRKKKKKAA